MDWQYPQDAKDSYKSRVVVKAYLEHYGKNKTIEQKARIHNGGLNGWKKESTIKYWNKIKRRM